MGCAGLLVDVVLTVLLAGPGLEVGVPPWRDTGWPQDCSAPCRHGALQAQQPLGLLTALAHDGVDQSIQESFCPIPQASQQLLG